MITTRWTFLFAISLFALSAACGDPKSSEPEDPMAAAMKDGFMFLPLDKAFEVAEQTDRIVYTFVTATWCGWCRKMENTTFQDETVQEVLTTAFVPTQLVTDKPTIWKGKQTHGQKVYEELNSTCQGFPCGFFLRGNRQKYRFEDLGGYKAPQEFIQILREKGPQPMQAVIDEIVATGSRQALLAE